VVEVGNTSDELKDLCDLGMAVGGVLAVEHYLSNGRWADEEKESCHGKVGVSLFVISLVGRMLLG
jgi:hypothetical protein